MFQYCTDQGFFHLQGGPDWLDLFLQDFFSGFVYVHAFVLFWYFFVAVQIHSLTKNKKKLPGIFIFSETCQKTDSIKYCHPVVTTQRFLMAVHDTFPSSCEIGRSRHHEKHSQSVSLSSVLWQDIHRRTCKTGLLCRLIVIWKNTIRDMFLSAVWWMSCFIPSV